MAGQTSMFEAFAPYYEIMVDWEARLRRESPMFQRVFQSVHANRVLDAACGPGHHAVLFARWGLAVSASDISPAMVERAAALTAAQGAKVEARQASIDEVSRVFPEPFDAVVCTGNSLSAAGKRSVAAAGIAEFFKVTRPGGTILLQVLNYELFAPGESVYAEPLARTAKGQNYIFLKVFRRAGTSCDLDVVVLQQGASETWTRTVFKEKLLVLDEAALVEMVEKAGFGKIMLYGGPDMAPFDRRQSENLIVVARKE
jgi:SAM-dependent methyltransferase